MLKLSFPSWLYKAIRISSFRFAWLKDAPAFIQPLWMTGQSHGDAHGNFPQKMWQFPKIGGVKNPPKWMVFLRENPIKMDDLEFPGKNNPTYPGQEL